MGILFSAPISYKKKLFHYYFLRSKSILFSSFSQWRLVRITAFHSNTQDLISFFYKREENGEKIVSFFLLPDIVISKTGHSHCPTRFHFWGSVLLEALCFKTRHCCISLAVVDTYPKPIFLRGKMGWVMFVQHNSVLQRKGRKRRNNEEINYLCLEAM